MLFTQVKSIFSTEVRDVVRTMFPAEILPPHQTLQGSSLTCQGLLLKDSWGLQFLNNGREARIKVSSKAAFTGILMLPQVVGMSFPCKLQNSFPIILHPFPSPRYVIHILNPHIQADVGINDDIREWLIFIQAVHSLRLTAFSRFVLWDCLL